MGKHSKKGHIKVYLERCKALDIKPHSRAMSGLMSTSTDGLLQSSWDSIVSREPKQPLFTTKGLLDYIVKLIVCKDEVCLPASVLVIFFD
ncbi:hypothetical protein L208DRAFT_1231518 [Tricholoma matsutake]|nr:hypothetical protein L208DRAFT_1231518 [Tricholoma matsutake 945]